MQFIKPIPFQEAIDKLGRQTIVTSKLNSQQWSAVPVALRDNAFFSATIESLQFLQRSKNFLNDFLTSTRETIPDKFDAEFNPVTALKAGSRSQFVRDMSRFAEKEGLGPLDPDLKGTIQDITSQKRLSLIFDTKTRQSYDFGNWKQGMDPDILDEFPAQRFIRVMEVKEPRDSHRQYEVAVALKSNLAFWIRINEDFGVPWGPWGWGCGHDVEDVDRAESEQLGLLAPGQTVEPAQKSLNDHLQASTANLDPDLVTFLKQSFGDQIELANNTARWIQKPAPTSAPIPAPNPHSSLIPHPSSLSSSPRQSPVSQAADIKVTNKSLPAIQHALKQIDLVHDDGKLNPITINHKVSHGAQGTYSPGGNYISVKRVGASNPAPTIIHETGHWLDHMALPGSGFSSQFHPDLAEWRQAVESSQAFQNLKTKSGYLAKRRYQRYQTQWTELWARSYYQYIATKSGDKILLDNLHNVLDGKTGYWIDSQWSSDDFKPIMLAIDNLFKKLNWI